jgi:Leucine-rich repeat (LRR) protein
MENRKVVLDAIDKQELQFVADFEEHISYEIEAGHIVELYIANLQRKTLIPQSITALQGLESLTMRSCHLFDTFPEYFSQLKALSSFEIESDQRDTVPRGLSAFKSLKKLILWIPQLKTIPSEVFELSSLEWLEILGGIYEAIPDLFKKLENIQTLFLSNLLKIVFLPVSISELKKLTRLSIMNCPLLYQLPSNLGNLASLRVLKLSGTPVAALPESLGGCAALEEIEITDGLTAPDAIPASIGQLKRLKFLSIYGGNLENVPAAIAGCESLERLWLVDCPQLKGLPAELESLPRLKSFMADRCPKLTPASKAIARRLEAKFHGPRRAH